MRQKKKLDAIFRTYDTNQSGKLERAEVMSSPNHLLSPNHTSPTPGSTCDEDIACEDSSRVTLTLTLTLSLSLTLTLTLTLSN